MEQRPRRRLHTAPVNPVPKVGGHLPDTLPASPRVAQRSVPVRSSSRNRRQPTAISTPWRRRIIGLTCAVLALWWLVSPIKRIDLLTGPNPEVSSALAAYFETHTKRNLFLNGPALESTLKQTVLHASAVSIRHDLLLSNLQVSVVSDNPAVRWQTGGLQYTLSGQGTALYQTPAKEDEQLPLLLDRAGVPVEIKTRIVPADFLAYIQELETVAASSKLVIHERAVVQSTRELEIKLEKRAYTVILSTRGRAGEQIKALLQLDSHFKKHGGTPKRYVDLRIPNRAYWR